MEKIIKIQNLSFVYGEDSTQKVLDNISLDIEKGSFTAIIGKNGSGKSTIAKNINGLLISDIGDVFVYDYNTKVEEDMWKIREKTGMVFQNPDNQIVSSIVEEDVAFGPENLGVEPSEIRNRVNKALEAVNMQDFRKRPPHMLSGGQKQRVAIAGAIAMEPDCIIFDEPTAMLDPRGRKEVMKIVDELHQKGITIILITHFMEEAVKADRVVIMNDGHIVMDSSPIEIFKRVDELRSLNLDVPLEIEIKHRLKDRGITIPDHVIDKESMVQFLCQLKSEI